MLHQRLQAFPLLHEQHSRSYRITVGAELSSTDLKLAYKLEAAHPKELAKVILPLKVEEPVRKPELWKGTCFECFIPSNRSGAYLEFNGAPSGCWNLYSFKKYREGMQEFKLNADAIPRQSVLTKSESQIDCEWTIPLIGIQQGFQSLGENHHEFSFIGFSAVLSTTVATTYWALKHDGIKPDFHVKTSFTYPIFMGQK